MRKRDGRSEWLRATKLARSIVLAFGESESTDPSPVLDLAVAVLREVRCGNVMTGAPISTASIATAVERMLVRAGRADVARRYAAARDAAAFDPLASRRLSSGLIGRG